MLLSAVTLSAALSGQVLEAPPPPPEAPLPDKVQPARQDQLGHEVTIRETEGRTIEEYRNNGQLYMVRVVPENGIPYYVVDHDGNGSIHTTEMGIQKVRPVMYTLFTW